MATLQVRVRIKSNEDPLEGEYISIDGHIAVDQLRGETRGKTWYNSSIALRENGTVISSAAPNHFSRERTAMASSDSTSISTLEEWRDVPSYEGLYKVSNLGRVCSLARKDTKGRRINEKILKPLPDGGGYLRVTLYPNVRGKKTPIHQLVARVFLGERPFKYEINHIDGNTFNNAVSNLEYVTKARNGKHAVEIGLHRVLRGEEVGRSKLKSVDVVNIVKLSEQGVSRRELCRRYRVGYSTIRGILVGVNWTHITGLQKRNTLPLNSPDAGLEECDE